MTQEPNKQFKDIPYKKDVEFLQLSLFEAITEYENSQSTFIPPFNTDNYFEDAKMTAAVEELGKTRGFEYLSDHFKRLPSRGTIYSAGYDFYAPYSFELKPGESIVISTNITSYMLPDEYLAIYPRSGQGFKYFARLANTVGIIDSDFYGNEIKVKIRNESTDSLLAVEKGQAFCQGIFQKYLLIDGDSFTEGVQRTGGFGSTDTEV